MSDPIKEFLEEKKERIKEERWNKLVFRLSKEEIKTFSKDLVMMGVEFMSLTPRHSLEDYFLQVTSGTQHVASFTN